MISISVNPDSCFSILTGLREWFSQTDERYAVPHVPVMMDMTSSAVSSQKNRENKERAANSLDNLHSTSGNSMMLDEFSDEDEEFQVAEAEQEVCIPLPL